MKTARQEIIAELSALAPRSPARKVLERILLRMTTKELRVEQQRLNRVRTQAGRRGVGT